MIYFLAHSTFFQVRKYFSHSCIVEIFIHLTLQVAAAFVFASITISCEGVQTNHHVASAGEI